LYAPPATGVMSFEQRVRSSQFCIEPAGDSPTRSHFYAAALLGCVPVIVEVTNKRHALFGTQGAAYAWRGEQPLACNDVVVDYTSAVVVLAGNATGTNGWIAPALRALNGTYGERAAALQQAAPAFGFADAQEVQQCNQKGRVVTDAFHIFALLVLRKHSELRLLGAT